MAARAFSQPEAPAVAEIESPEAKARREKQEGFVSYLRQIVNKQSTDWDTRINHSRMELGYGNRYMRESQNEDASDRHFDITVGEYRRGIAQGAYYNATSNLISGLHSDLSTLQTLRRHIADTFPEIKPVDDAERAKMITSHLLDEAKTRALNRRELARLADAFAFLEEPRVFQQIDSMKPSGTAEGVHHAIAMIASFKAGKRLEPLHAPVIAATAVETTELASSQRLAQASALLQSLSGAEVQQLLGQFELVARNNSDREPNVIAAAERRHDRRHRGRQHGHSGSGQRGQRAFGD